MHDSILCNEDYMMAEEIGTSPEDTDLDYSFCVICIKPFSDKNSPVSPDIIKLGTLFKACEARQDGV